MTPLKAGIAAFVVTFVAVIGFAFMAADTHGPGAYERGRLLGAGAVQFSFVVALVVSGLVRLVRGPTQKD
jgi:hypothetical protein